MMLVTGRHEVDAPFLKQRRQYHAKSSITAVPADPESVTDDRMMHVNNRPLDRLIIMGYLEGLLQPVVLPTAPVAEIHDIRGRARRVEGYELHPTPAVRVVSLASIRRLPHKRGVIGRPVIRVQVVVARGGEHRRALKNVGVHTEMPHRQFLFCPVPVGYVSEVNKKVPCDIVHLSGEANLCLPAPTGIAE